MLWREWASWSFWRFWLRPRWGDWVPFCRIQTPTPLGRILNMDQLRLLTWNSWRMQDHFLPCWGGFLFKDFSFRWKRHLSRGLPLGTSDPRRQILSDLGWLNWIMGRLCRWKRRLVLLLPPGISNRSYIREEVILFAPCLRLLGRYLFGDLLGVFSSSGPLFLFSSLSRTLSYRVGLFIVGRVDRSGSCEPVRGEWGLCEPDRLDSFQKS